MVTIVVKARTYPALSNNFVPYGQDSHIRESQGIYKAKG